MNIEKLIFRINELYKKSQSEGLTPEEKEEQKNLRQEYIKVITGNVKAQLDTIKKKPKDEEAN